MNYEVVAMVANLERQHRMEEVTRQQQWLGAAPAQRMKKSHRLFARKRAA